MKKNKILRSLLCCLALAVSSGCGKALPEPFEENGKWGYRLKDGTVRVKPGFIAANEFSKKGVAFAADMEAWLCLDAGGHVLLRPFIYDNGPDDFSEGLARFTEAGRTGFFDTKCRKVIPALYDSALPFRDGAAEGCFGCKETAAGEHKVLSGGKWGLIDVNGNVLVKPEHAGPEAARKAAD